MRSCDKHANEENISFTRILKVKTQKHNKKTETYCKNQPVRTRITRLEITHCTLALNGLQWPMFTWMATSSGCGDKGGSKRGSQEMRYKD